MQALAAILCDSAADYQGKLCVLGAFDSIYAGKFPAVHPHCALAIRLLFKPEEEGVHEMKITLIDSDGKNVLPDAGGPTIRFEVPEVPEDTFFLSRNFVLDLNGLPLPKAGQYSFDISIGGKIIARVPLQAMSVPQQQQMAG
ncbi:MAG: hypothetical protein JSR82_16920 [Verrucomicrobia bacterium]|nr:hypothetical protein [Verrucomicrobiota bacterium]